MSSSHFNKNGDSVVANIAPKDTSTIVKIEDLKPYVWGIGSGNPESVLLTSEFDLKKSKSFPLVLEKVFEPATQVYFLRKK